jgi:hypothetical protein
MSEGNFTIPDQSDNSIYFLEITNTYNSTFNTITLPSSVGVNLIQIYFNNKSSNSITITSSNSILSPTNESSLSYSIENNCKIQYMLRSYVWVPIMYTTLDNITTTSISTTDLSSSTITCGTINSSSSSTDLNIGNNQTSSNINIGTSSRQAFCDINIGTSTTSSNNTITIGCSNSTSSAYTQTDLLGKVRLGTTSTTNLTDIRFGVVNYSSGGGCTGSVTFTEMLYVPVVTATVCNIGISRYQLFSVYVSNVSKTGFDYAVNYMQGLNNGGNIAYPGDQDVSVSFSYIAISSTSNFSY